MTTASPHSEIYTIARCLKELIVNKNLDEALNNIVAWLAGSLNIDRCYISEAGPGGDVNRLTGIYAGEGNACRVPVKTIQEALFNARRFPEILSLLESDQCFKVSITDDISPELHTVLSNSGLQSLLLIPLHSGRRYWGFIGFGDTVNARTWRRSEAELKSLATAIGVAIETARNPTMAAQAGDNEKAAANLCQFTWQVHFADQSLHLSGNYTRFLPEAAGASVDEFIDYLSKNIHAEDALRTKKQLLALLQCQQATSSQLVLRLPLPGSRNYQWVHCDCQLLVNAAGVKTGIAGVVCSVTSSVQAAFYLKKQNELFQFLVQNPDRIVFSLDGQGNINSISPAVTNVLGRTVQECQGQNLVELVPPAEIQNYWQHFGSLLLDNANAFDQQMQLAHKNGQLVWVRIKARSTRNMQGQVTGIFGSIENINHSYAAELLLKESNDKLNTILNNSKEIILTIDLEHNVIESVNDAIAILGYRPDEWIGKQSASWSDDQRNKFQELMKLAVKAQLQVANQQITFANKRKTALITFEFSTNLFYYKNTKYLLCVLRDISERVHYEQSISRISDQLSHLINNIDDVYAIYDLQQQQYEFVSGNVEQLYGCSRETFCNRGLIWADVIHLEDLPGIRNSMDAIIRSCSKGNFFYRITTPAGEVKMIYEKVIVNRKSNHDPGKLYIVKTDYTHLENIERSFIESERKFRFISENISDFIAIHDTDWNFTYASPSVKNILGYEPEEIAGMAGFDLVHPDDLLPTMNELLRPLVLEQKETKYRYRLRAKNGSYKWVETYSKAVVDAKGETTSIIASSRNVTEQVIAETRLKTSEEQYRLLSENSNDVIATYNLSGRFTYVSLGCLQVLGYASAELLGHKPGDVLAKDQANRQLVEDNIAAVVSGGGPRTFIFKALTKSGIERSLEVVLQPIVKNNEMVGIQAATRDVTEREKLLIELEQSLAKERELNELRSMFVATASHQFRTPLTIIQSGIEIMELYLDDLPEARRQKFKKQFTSIQGEVERLESLMSDILLLGRANAGRTPFSPQRGNLVDFIQRIINNKYNNRYPPERNIVFAVTGPVTEVDFDEKLIGHAVENIISNAYKYSRQGNLRVTMHFARHQVKIAVADKGIGIPAEDLKNLFEPFYRATNTDEIEGTGLGLAIVKEFIEKHRGKILITSKLNKGTTVNVILPVTQKS